MCEKRNEKKEGFWSKLVKKFDNKLKEKAKNKSCCSPQDEDKGESCCSK